MFHCTIQTLWWRSEVFVTYRMQGNPDFLILPSNSHAQKGRGQKTVFPNENICQLFFGSPIPYMKSFGGGIGLFHSRSTFMQNSTGLGVGRWLKSWRRSYISNTIYNKQKTACGPSIFWFIEIMPKILLISNLPIN